MVLIAAVIFRKQLRSFLDEVELLFERVEKVSAFDVSTELAEQLLNEAKPSLQTETSPDGIELSVSREHTRLDIAESSSWQGLQIAPAKRTKW